MENLTVIFSGVNCISVAILIFQAFLLKKQIKLTHEQARRDKTVEILFEWNNLLHNINGHVEKIVGILDSRQCEALYKRQPFKVNQEIKNMLCELCENRNNHECVKCKSNNGEFVVDGLLLTQLRWHIVSYLNAVEVIMVAWQQAVVDKDIIEMEFDYLYDSESGKNLLKNFREVTHAGNAYPLIDEFCNVIKKKKSPQASIKKEID